MRSCQVCDDQADCDRRTAALREAAVTGAAPATRSLIRNSWRRSLAAGVDPAIQAAPLVFDADTVDDARAAHPLGRHLPMVHEMLRHVAEATDHLMVVTGGDGCVLWSEGPRDVRRHAEAVGLMEGFRWSEEAIGTNGIGTALGARAPAYVRCAEHLARVLHRWSCAAVPIADPDTGQVIGCVNVSATEQSLHPAVMALVEAAARLTEARLTLDMHRRDERLRVRYRRHLRGDTRALVTPSGRIVTADPDGWRGERVAAPWPGARVTLPDGRATVAETLGRAYLLRTAAAGERRSLSLRLLGDEHPYALLDGRHIPLSLRHAELLALLALHPTGLTGERSSLYLYGDEGNPVTVRAGIHRLRAQLGDVVRAKPYRLDCDIDTDFLTVRRLLSAGDVRAALRMYTGPLLPRSEAPAIQAARDELAGQLRAQILQRGCPDALWQYVRTVEDDLEILARLSTALPPGDPRGVAARMREHRMLQDD